ncbi:hypothetical protein POM88_041491 [Heracleum sosnowskyi]|uniref:Uncharacterized protein n=1 Tax=Heracleum sosnowskyi TaxID=360622 RepID=A0AAD8HEC7_9APIA|nr:hypothetical protein POM88_041491 [Heracleum sosnowskyi]
MKPTLSSAMNPPVPTSDTSTTLKSTADLSTALSSSTALVRPSHAAPATRFGSALNIETLVPAAEQRETVIQYDEESFRSQNSAGGVVSGDTCESTKGGDSLYTSFSLAFDTITNDYKIIRLVSLRTHPLIKSRIEIYSANQDS